MNDSSFPAVLRLYILGLVLFAAVDTVHTARAHGGLIVLQTNSGPYHIAAMVSRDTLIDETIALSEADSQRPVFIGLVTLSLLDGAGNGSGQFLARPVGGVFEARYPAPKGSGWRVFMSIDGPLGPAAVEHRFQAPAAEWTIGGTTGLLLNFAALTFLLGAPVFAYWRWLRPASLSPSDSPTLPDKSV